MLLKDKIKLFRDDDQNLQKKQIFLADFLFFLITFIFLDSLYVLFLGLQMQYITHILFNIFYSYIFASLTLYFRSKKGQIGTIVHLFLIGGVVILHIAEAIHFKSVKTFALWEDLIRSKELTGVMDEVWKMIPQAFILFLLPIFLAVFYAIYLKKKDKHRFDDFKKRTWKQEILLYLAIIVGVIGTNVLLVYGVHDYNKKSLQNSKSYIQKYGVMDAVLYNTLQFFVLNRIDQRVAAEEIDEARNLFTYNISQNEFTNKYKGKNLILITGESIAPFGITKEFTPTLYRMREEAYNFSNYYSVRPNTFNSEFATLTSFYLTPEKEQEDFIQISDQTLPGLFSNIGYQAYAFHNFTGDFYNRNEKFIEMGFDKFLDATDLGIPISEKIFAHSDEQLFDNSFQYYSNELPFFYYYLTVTSHGFYRSIDRETGSVPTIRDKIDYAKKLYPEMDDSVQTYLASIGVTDDGVASLLHELTTTGKVDDTVIIFVGDHYPYMMGDEVITPNFEVNNLELYKVPYFIWDASHPSKNVDTYTSNIDILPTLANLFDLPLKYTMGFDVFSLQAEKIILEWYDYRSYSFITQSGGYDANTNIYYGGYTEADVIYYTELMLHRASLNNMQFVLNRV